MGAVTFSLDKHLLTAVKIALSPNILIETGTFNGDSVAAVISDFERIYTIELSKDLWDNAVERFKSQLNVTVMHGNSPEVISQLRDSVNGESVLYWLDAHWCVADATAGEQSQCPLLAELAAIGQLNVKSAILIDDARLFLAPPQAPHESSHWPRFHEIITALFKLNSNHQVMVVNDVIAFFPEGAREGMEDYARAFGVDWLAAANFLRNPDIAKSLEQKEAVIQKQIRDLNELKRRLELQERVSRRLSFALKSHQAMGDYVPFMRTIVRGARRGKAILRPRLGMLVQYTPRPLTATNAPSADTVLRVAPRISIVTPSFGQGAFIEYTLQSVLGQRYPNLEYYVQDGGSTDQTVTVLRKYERDIAGWESVKDGGQSHAINLGFRRTTGEIMGWLNSDDMLMPGTLAIVAQYFVDHPLVDVVYGDRLMIDENNMEIGRWVLPGHSDKTLLWADYIPQETLFWRRQIWEKSGASIDESFQFAMDWDLLVRFRESGARFAHIPKFLGAFRVHGSQKTSTLMENLGSTEMNRIRERTLGRSPSARELRRALMPYTLRHIGADLAYRIGQRLGASGRFI